MQRALQYSHLYLKAFHSELFLEYHRVAQLSTTAVVRGHQSRHLNKNAFHVRNNAQQYYATHIKTCMNREIIRKREQEIEEQILHVSMI